MVSEILWWLGTFYTQSINLHGITAQVSNLKMFKKAGFSLLLFLDKITNYKLCCHLRKYWYRCGLNIKLIFAEFLSYLKKYIFDRNKILVIILIKFPVLDKKNQNYKQKRKNVEFQRHVERCLRRESASIFNFLWTLPSFIQVCAWRIHKQTGNF